MRKKVGNVEYGKIVDAVLNVFFNDRHIVLSGYRKTAFVKPYSRGNAVFAEH